MQNGNWKKLNSYTIFWTMSLEQRNAIICIEYGKDNLKMKGIVIIFTKKKDKVVPVNTIQV